MPRAGNGISSAEDGIKAADEAVTKALNLSFVIDSSLLLQAALCS